MLNRKLSSTFPFLSTKDLDLAGLKHIWAHSTIFLSPCRIQRQPGTDSVLTLRSSVNALMGGWYWADVVLGSLHSGSADWISTSMAREKSFAEMVHPMMMPTSTQCLLDVIPPRRDPHPEVAVVIGDVVSDSVGDMMFAQLAALACVRWSHMHLPGWAQW